MTTYHLSGNSKGVIMTEWREKRTKASLLSGCKKEVKSSKLLQGRSTVSVLYTDGSRAVRYHDTDVITWNVDGSITLDSGGFRTSTTKERISSYADDIKIGQDKGVWYIYKLVMGPEGYKVCTSTDLLFYDGITFSADGELLTEKLVANDKVIRRVKKKIAAFVKLVDDLDTIPMPDNGDCWHCLMKETKTGKTLGDVTKDHSHLESHLEEKYLHGSLIFNALADKGYKNPGFIMQAGVRSIIKRALRTYLTKRLLPDLCTN